MSENLPQSYAMPMERMRNFVAGEVRDMLGSGTDSQLIEFCERLTAGDFHGYETVKDVDGLIRALALHALCDELVRRLGIRQMESDG